MNKKWSARIASVLLVLHGLIEIAGLFLVRAMPGALTSFGGLTGPTLEQNVGTVALFGVLWGIGRLAAAWGSWTTHKWAVALGIVLSAITMTAAVTIIPAGATDTLFSLPVLILLLYTWFGNERLEKLYTPNPPATSLVE
jgi:hypothetical protein